jgi:hypothetical protein
VELKAIKNLLQMRRRGKPCYELRLCGAGQRWHVMAKDSTGNLYNNMSIYDARLGMALFEYDDHLEVSRMHSSKVPGDTLLTHAACKLGCEITVVWNGKACWARLERIGGVRCDSKGFSDFELYRAILGAIHGVSEVLATQHRLGVSYP